MRWGFEFAVFFPFWWLSICSGSGVLELSKFSGCTWTNPESVCRDAENTGIALGGKLATCTQLQPYCNYPGGWDVIIQGACPVSCNACPDSSFAKGPRQLHSAPAEWEAVISDSNSTVSTVVMLPAAGNEEGCNQHDSAWFEGKIALLARGAKSCSFGMKAWNAQQAGASAVLLYDNNGANTIALVAITTSSPRPSIPTWLISLADGTDMVTKIGAGEDCYVTCSWGALDVWFDQPDGFSKVNDSLVVSNSGDDSLIWEVQVELRLFENTPDQFYTASLVSPAPEWATSGVSSTDLPGLSRSTVVDNGASLLSLPFSFPLYLTYYDEVHVSSNGLLIFDDGYSPGTDAVGELGTDDDVDALIAPFWYDLICDEACAVSYSEVAASSETGGAQAVVIRYDNLTFSEGKVSFDSWLYSDGRISVVYQQFTPTANYSGVKVGVESPSATRYLALDASSAMPFNVSNPFMVSFTPWFRPSSGPPQTVPVGGSVTFEFQTDPLVGLMAWLMVRPFTAERVPMQRRFVRLGPKLGVHSLGWWPPHWYMPLQRHCLPLRFLPRHSGHPLC